MPPPPDEHPCGDCICCWRRICSPWIPRVAPGKDYVCMPAGADDRPAWSLLVGLVGDSGLGLHRFRVALSGRVLGRSDGVLETVHNVVDAQEEDEDKKSTTCTIEARANLSPDGRSLLVFCRQQRSSASSYEIVEPPRALRLQLDLLNLNETAVSSPLPRLPLKRPMSCRPVSANGHIWAPYLHLPLYSRTSSRLVMLRLDVVGGRWVEAAAMDVQYKAESEMSKCGSMFQGQVVVGQKILVSLRPSKLFFCFDCVTCSWSPVTKNSRGNYIPIQGRGVYVKEDRAIYFQLNNGIFAYEVPYYDNNLQALMLNPPKRLALLCPYFKGSSLLTHLCGGLMCSVWISNTQTCSCDYFHVIISTFRVGYVSGYVGKVIEILHSTCRRLEILPSNIPPEFSFLQEYKDEYNDKNVESCSKQLPKEVKDPTSSSCAVKSSKTVKTLPKMLDCCREYLVLSKPLHRCYVLEEPAVQINKALYIVGEGGAHSTLYLTNIVNGRLNTCHDNSLEPRQTITTGDKVPCQPSPWHFICSRSKIHAVSADHIYEFDLKGNSCSLLNPSWPSSFSLAMALQVGDEIIAVTHYLDVLCYASSTSRWEYYLIDTPCPPPILVKISGYVVLSAETFMVFYDESSKCLLLDLRVRRWRAVLFPPTSLSQYHGSQLLSGRCVYVEGFIYSCTSGGLVAYEFCDDSTGVYLSEPICLTFTWRIDKWKSERMCLEYAGKDIVSGAIIFCVVQGEAYRRGRGQDVYITVVQVKTKRTLSDKMMPVSIEHVDIATCFVPCGQELICTGSCFAV